MTGQPPKPLLVEDDQVRDLVATLAAYLGVTEELAIKTAVEAELRRREDALVSRGTVERKDRPSLRERLDELYRRYPKPTPTGLPADKAFYDEMSGEFD